MQLCKVPNSFRHGFDIHVPVCSAFNCISLIIYTFYYKPHKIFFQKVGYKNAYYTYKHTHIYTHTYEYIHMYIYIFNRPETGNLIRKESLWGKLNVVF